MKLESVILDQKDGVAKITLNRPKVLNAMNLALLKDLVEALKEADADPSVKVIIITGAGRAFSAGRDFKEVGSSDFQIGGDFYASAEKVSKPVIAAVNGPCYTGALELVMCCDLVIASESAVFADTHARFGIVSGGGQTQRLPRLLGKLKAKELLFTSEPITAREAERIGLVNKVVPADQLDNEVEALAGKIKKNSPRALATIKALINDGSRTTLASGLKLETDTALTYRSADALNDIQERLEGRSKTKSES